MEQEFTYLWLPGAAGAAPRAHSPFPNSPKGSRRHGDRTPVGVCPSALGAARSPSSLGLHCPCTGPGVTERAHLVLLFYANPVSTSIFGGRGGRWRGGHACSSGPCRGVPIPASTGGVPGAAACWGDGQPPGGVMVGGRANSISTWGREKKKKK